jgi:hypothetical protein
MNLERSIYANVKIVDVYILIAHIDEHFNDYEEQFATL